jgi:diketogulonate reductase-like aldo/keto reductase
MFDTQQFDDLKKQSHESSLSRRDFVQVLSAAAAAGPGLVAAGISGFALTGSQRAEAAEAIAAGLGKLPKVAYGKTGFKVTPLCICQDWRNSEVLAAALAVDVNFIHKAGYWGARAPVPEELKKLPRESYYTDITVDTTSPGQNPDDFDQAYNQVVSSLDKNGLQYYDVYRAHYGWHTPDKLNKETNTSYKAYLKLKKEGKVRHFGVSQHPYANAGGQEQIDKYAIMTQALIDSGIIESMQVWFAYGYPKEVMNIFAKASEAGIAMTAMKVNAHGRDKLKADPAKMEELKANNMAGRAAIRWVLEQKRADGKPIFQTCVSNIQSMEVFDENVGGASSKVAALDGWALPWAQQV